MTKKGTTPVTRKQSALQGLLADVVVYVAISALVATCAVLLYDKSTEGQEMSQQRIELVAIDTQGLLEEQLAGTTALVRLGKLKPDDISSRTKAFMDALALKAAEYAGQGVVVLDSKAIVAAPAHVQDVTEQIRQELLQGGEMLAAGSSKE